MQVVVETKQLTAPAIAVHLSSNRSGYRFSRPAVVRIIGEIAALIPSLRAHPMITEMSLSFVDDGRMRVINRDFRGKDKTTDVLSFPQVHSLKDRTGTITSPSLGDIVISVARAKVQAKEYGVTLNAEIVRLMIHGMLHLCGYDHEGVPAAEAQRMRRLEQRIYEKLCSQAVTLRFVRRR